VEALKLFDIAVYGDVAMVVVESDLLPPDPWQAHVRRILRDGRKRIEEIWTCGSAPRLALAKGDLSRSAPTRDFRISSMSFFSGSWLVADMLY